jgi:hypothetical protein
VDGIGADVDGSESHDVYWKVILAWSIQPSPSRCCDNASFHC